MKARLSAETVEIIDAEFSLPEDFAKKSRPEFGMRGNGKGESKPGPGQYDVRPFLPRNAPTGLDQSSNRLLAGDDQKPIRHRSLDGEFESFSGEPGLALHHVDPAFDRLSDIRDRLFPSPALRETPRKRRNLGHEETRFVLLDLDM